MLNVLAKVWKVIKWFFSRIISQVFVKLIIIFSGCSVTLTNPSGDIISPGYPHHGYTYVDCTWLIQVEPGYTIHISIISFYLGHINEYRECIYFR